LPSKTTLVLGIGNPLMQDDGIGVLVVQKLKETYGNIPSTKLLDGGTLSFHLIGEIEDATNLIVIDSAQLRKIPGSIKVFQGADMDCFLGEQKNSSVHDLTLVDLLSIALLNDQLPRNRAMIGIQPECLDWGLSPTQTVADSIPDACRITLELLHQWNL
jgi:hydrogenase maturation protease